MKDVPFSEIVFIQYPTFTDSADPNRVVPDYDAADTLWAALAANQPLQLSGNLGDGNGVIVDENAQPTPTDTVTPAPTDSATPTPEPSSSAITLPSEIAGQTAAQATCSNGNVR